MSSVVLDTHTTKKGFNITVQWNKGTAFSVNICFPKKNGADVVHEYKKRTYHNQEAALKGFKYYKKTVDKNAPHPAFWQ